MPRSATSSFAGSVMTRPDHGGNFCKSEGVKAVKSFADMLLDDTEVKADEVSRQFDALQAEMEAIPADQREPRKNEFKARFLELLAKHRALGERLLSAKVSFDDDKNKDRPKN
jgi:hypothetical protein